MTDSKNVELKPCPFCGGKSELFIGNFFAMASCLECGIHTKPFDYDDFEKEKAVEKAVEIWNRRAGNE